MYDKSALQTPGGQSNAAGFVAPVRFIELCAMPLYSCLLKELIEGQSCILHCDVTPEAGAYEAFDKPVCIACVYCKDSS